MTALDEAEPKPLTDEELKTIENIARIDKVSNSRGTNLYGALVLRLLAELRRLRAENQQLKWTPTDEELNGEILYCESQSEEHLANIFRELLHLRAENMELKAKIAEHLKAFKMEDWK